MHGICTEILKLVRASAALHSISDRESRNSRSFGQSNQRSVGTYDTEATYFELLKLIGRKLDLRVIVDVIAGASAGGITGTMLARAICHDLPIDRLSDLWLEKADIGILLAPEARAGRWSKLAMRPLLWGASATGMLGATHDAETRKNLSLFVRSRWLKPPLDGDRMTGLMLDAVNALGEPTLSSNSLLPKGQGLDLFVTLTDYHGRPNILQIHDPALVQEYEHRHLLRFRYRRNQHGNDEDDLSSADGPALAFAARATSSFPGAFPPARIAEIDRVLAARGECWSNRQRFIDRCFSAYVEGGFDPLAAYFIDGSVLNNRPFKEAIAAIRDRPAYREVDRRLLYIDPLPEPFGSVPITAMPGFLSTIRAAVSDLPRSQPVADELNALAAQNERKRQLRLVIDEARPRITQLVAETVRQMPTGTITSGQVTSWRQEVHIHARLDAGFAYDSYVKLKLRGTLGTLGRIVAELRGCRRRSNLERFIELAFEAWADQSGVLTTHRAGKSLGKFSARHSSTWNWLSLLQSFDIAYCERRIRFLIECQNRFYSRIARSEITGLAPSAVDTAKRQLYSLLDWVAQLAHSASANYEMRTEVISLFPDSLSTLDSRKLKEHAASFVTQNFENIEALISRLNSTVDLPSKTLELDILLAGLAPTAWPDQARHEVLINYLGFPYWDVLTLPISAGRDDGDFRETLVDRISPLDAPTVNSFAGAAKLQGKALGCFAGFFSRAYRENDYMLGRLHAVDRLIDIVCDAAGLLSSSHTINIVDLKKKAFGAVLQAEKNRLIASAELKSSLRRSIMML